MTLQELLAWIEHRSQELTGPATEPTGPPARRVATPAGVDSIRLRQQRSGVVAEVRRILQVVEDARSDRLTGVQERDVDALVRQFDEMTDQIAVLEWDEREAVRRGALVGGGSPDSEPEGRLRVLAPEQRMVDHVREVRGSWSGTDEQPRLAPYLRGLITGQWDGAEVERRVLGESTLAGGGYLVPEPLAAEIIDLARNQARVMQAGARTIPMDSQTLKIARLASDPTASWVNEATVVAPDATMAFERVTLTARKLMGLAKISRELVEDAPNAEGEVKMAIAKALGIELDRVGLRGSGAAPEPKGIRNQTGVTIVEQGAGNGATPANYDSLIDAVGVLEDANEAPNGVIWAPRTGRTYAKLKDTTNQPLQVPFPVSQPQLPKYSTKQVPTNLTVGTSTNCSDIYIADWTQLLIGMRVELQIRVVEELYAESDQIGIVARLRADVALARAAAFVIMTGVRP